MKTLNLNLNVFGSREYIASDNNARGTWIQLLGYCADCENGGRIAGAADFSDTLWGLVGVTADAVNRANWLVTFDQGDAVVFGYPIDEERIFRAKRAGGKKSGLVRVNNVKSVRRVLEDSSKTLTKSLHEHQPEIPDNLKTDEFMQAWGEWLAYRRVRKLSAYKPQTADKQLAELSEWGHDEAIHAINDSIRQNWQGLFPPKTSAAGGRKASFA
jgi:hypothetical protein